MDSNLEIFLQVSPEDLHLWKQKNQNFDFSQYEKEYYKRWYSNNLTIQPCWGDYYLSNAFEFGYYDLFEQLSSQEPSLSKYSELLLESAAKMGKLDYAKQFIALGANHYDSPMVIAAKNGHLEMVKLMLEKGATDYNNALKDAASKGHSQIVQLMLEKGATNYSEALKLAKIGNHTETINRIREILELNILPSIKEE